MFIKLIRSDSGPTLVNLDLVEEIHLVAGRRARIMMNSTERMEDDGADYSRNFVVDDNFDDIAKALKVAGLKVIRPGTMYAEWYARAKKANKKFVAAQTMTFESLED